MKKISAVLLVLVLVGSVAFAGFTGSATTELGLDLDSGEYGFSNDTAVSVDLTLGEFIGEAKGEGDIYAEINATLNFVFSNATDDSVADDPANALYPDFSLNYAKVVGDGWYVSIKEALSAPNFATSAIDSKELKNGNRFVSNEEGPSPFPVADLDADDTAVTVNSGVNQLGYSLGKTYYPADVLAKEYLDKTSGVEIGYKDFVVSLGLSGDYVDNTEYDDDGETALAAQDDETFMTLYGALVTPAFELADGMTFTFGVAGSMASEDGGAADSAISASAKVNYADDMMAVAVGGDVIYDDGDVDADVAVSVVYDAISFDAYYATVEKYRTGAGTEADDDDLLNIVDGELLGDDVVVGDDNLMSVKVGYTMDNMTFALVGKNLFNAQDLSAEFTYALNDATTVGVTGGYVIADEEASAGVSAEYVAEKYTAAAAVGFGYVIPDEEATLELDLGVSSSTLIAGADLYLGYYVEDLITAQNKGAVTAGVSIAF